MKVEPSTPATDNNWQNGSKNKSKSPLPIAPNELPQNVTSRGFVSAKELFGIIRDGHNNVLVIDCRSENDFSESKLKYDHLVNVPEEIIRNG